MAAKMGHIELVKLLVKHGSEVMAQGGEQGITALHWAAHKEMGEVALYLIESGGDVMAKDRMGRTPLSMATAELATKMKGGGREGGKEGGRDNYLTTPLSLPLQMLLSAVVHMSPRVSCRLHPAAG